MSTSVGLYHTDINECKKNNGGCAPEASCENTVPMRKCTCKAGFTGDGKTCHGKSASVCQHALLTMIRLFLRILSLPKQLPQFHATQFFKNRVAMSINGAVFIHHN